MTRPRHDAYTDAIERAARIAHEQGLSLEDFTDDAIGTYDDFRDPDFSEIEVRAAVAEMRIKGLTRWAALLEILHTEAIRNGFYKAR